MFNFLFFMIFRVAVDYSAALSPRQTTHRDPIIRRTAVLRSIRYDFWGVMGIRSLVAAAAVVMGIGQAVDAAAIRFDLRYEKTILESATIFDTRNDVLLWNGDLDLEGTSWELPTLYSGAKKGDTFKAYAEIVEADENDPYGGYIVPTCNVGGFDCSIYNWWERYVSIGSFTFVADAFGVWQHGETLIVTSWGEYHGQGFQISGNGYEGSAGAITTTFTIVQPAPVPLPASAALLPLGLGALALMRRRRRLA